MRNAVVLTMLDPFVMSARECAMQMLQNGTYMQKELANVRMSDELRRQAEDVCGELIGTKHDVMTELFDLKDLVSTDAPDEKVAERVMRIVQWALDDLRQLHAAVTALEEESRQDAGVTLASILVMESAGNILQAFGQMKSAAEGVLRALRDTTLPR